MTGPFLAVAAIWGFSCGLIGFRWWLAHQERYRVTVDASAIKADLDEFRSRLNRIEMSRMK